MSDRWIQNSWWSEPLTPRTTPNRGEGESAGIIPGVQIHLPLLQTGADRACCRWYVCVTPSPTPLLPEECRQISRQAPAAAISVVLRLRRQGVEKILLAMHFERVGQRDWYFIAEQPAPAPHLAHPEGCAAQRIVLVTVPRVSRSCDHFPHGFDPHLPPCILRELGRGRTAAANSKSLHQRGPQTAAFPGSDRGPQTATFPGSEGVLTAPSCTPHCPTCTVTTSARARTIEKGANEKIF